MQRRSENHIILYDGTCVLCDSFIRFIKKKDKKNLFRYEPYNSPFGLSYSDLLTLEKYGTVGLLYKNRLLVKSDAALTILRLLGFPWNIFYIIILIPRFLRDALYRWIAKNRYTIFGKKENCEL